MSRGKYRVPKWVATNRKLVKQSKKDLLNLRRISQTKIQRALEEQKFIDQSLEEVKYVEEMFDQDLPPEMWGDEYVEATGTLSSGSLACFPGLVKSNCA